MPSLKLDTSFTADNSGSTDTVPQVKDASKQAPLRSKIIVLMPKDILHRLLQKFLKKRCRVESITGSGKGGRITKEDALTAATPVVKMME